MKNLILKPKKKALLPLFVIAFLHLLFLSCTSQTESTGVSIPALKKIDQTPPTHYKALSELSPTPEQHNKHLDEIKFPDQAHKLTIKLFSPAYLERAEINQLIQNFKPPANSSKQTRAELDFLLALQESRTPEQVAEALRMHDIVYFPLIGMRKDEDLFFEVYEVLGKQFNPQKYPKTQKLLDNIMKEMRITEFTAKNHFLRARPRQLDSALQPLKKMSSSSFASGHTLWAYMQAYILSELMPEKRKDFLEVAYKIGFSREILGVHYPSDEEASRKLAHQLLAKMWDKAAFTKDFQAAQTEWQNP